MLRVSIQYLENWRSRPTRKPLVIRGARQVGKSHLVRTFAAADFGELLEIDFEADRDAASLFDSRDPATIVSLLEVRYGKRILPGSTLLFLDEIQAAPEVFAVLRYFREKMPELHVIAAGSLLDFALADHTFSMPVGRIEYLHLGPMTFEEFVLAHGHENLVDFLRGFELDSELPDAIHRELLRLFRRYLVVGGMPSSIAASLGPSGLLESDRERQSLLATYRDDFSKYSRRSDHHRMEKVWSRIPRLVGSVLKYSTIDRDEKARDLAKALDLLCLARVAHRVRHTAANGLPLGAEADDRAFKVLTIDVGLLCRSCGLGAVEVEQAEDPMLINAGAVCEQFVGQHLLHSGELYAEPELFCWLREKSRSNAEIDYVIAVGEAIVPVEVKAGRTGSLKSLHVFLDEKKLDFAVRFNTDKPSIVDATTSVVGRERRDFRLLSLPFYLVGQTHRLCRTQMDGDHG